MVSVLVGGHDAIVYDEKVTTMMASCRQRLRWAQGQFDCAGRYIPKLFAIGIKTGNIMILDGIIPSESTLFLIVDNRNTWCYPTSMRILQFIQIFCIKLCLCLYGQL